MILAGPASTCSGYRVSRTCLAKSPRGPGDEEAAEANSAQISAPVILLVGLVDIADISARGRVFIDLVCEVFAI